MSSIVMCHQRVLPTILRSTGLSRNLIKAGTKSNPLISSNTMVKTATTTTTIRPFSLLSSSMHYNNAFLQEDSTNSLLSSKLEPTVKWFSSTTGTDATASSTSSSSSSSTSSTNEDPTHTEPPPSVTDDAATESNGTETVEDPLEDIDFGLDKDDGVENDVVEEPIDVEEDASIVAARKNSQQVRELKDALLRSLAEQENTRTIAKRDVEQARQFAIKSFAKSLLEVADNLQRALEAVPTEYRPGTAASSNISTDEVVPTPTAPLSINPDIFQTLYEGIEMTEKGLKKALESHGVLQYGTVGDIFDPNKHEALMEYPDNTKLNNTVGIVMKCGYTLHSRVLRPAEVGVVKSTLTSTTAETTASAE